MNITAAINIPCVSQTNLWKGCFEAHFMSGREIKKLICLFLMMYIKQKCIIPRWKVIRYC
jgi:hypothetical protein